MEEIFNLVNAMSPYLLLGFLFAGILHAFIPNTVYTRYLGGHSFRSVLYATLFGIPLPLCSCGVIPTAMSLRREGASKSSTVAFLVATPQTGVDSIAATYSLMGLPFAITRPIAAFFTSLLAGCMVNVFDKNDDGDATAEASCDSGSTTDDGQRRSFLTRVAEALRYAYFDMLGDIGKWLFIGLLVAGMITVFVPDSFFEIFKGNTLLSMLLVLCIAIPMYVCATGSIPVAIVLMMKGLTPGAALVLLMAGPACNVASILVIGKVLGRRTLTVYLASIILGSIVAGTIIDHLPTEWFMPLAVVRPCCMGDNISWINYASTAALCLLFLNVIIQRYWRKPAPAPETQKHKNTTTMKEIRIKGMNCSHCAASATKALQSLPGVTEATVDLASGKARIVGDTTFEAIQQALEGLGFSAEEA